MHFYLALLGLVGGLVVLAVNLWAYYDERIVPSEIAFATLAATATILFITWFWGMFLSMSGKIPIPRLGYLLLHGSLGAITPLLYGLIISAQLPHLATQPVGDLEINLSMVSLLVAILQFISGWAVLGRRPWRALIKLIPR